MKQKQLTFFLLAFCIVGSFQMEAQIFKKIQRSAENAAERTVLRKTEQKTAEKVDESIDDALEGEEKEKRKKNKKSQSKKSGSDAFAPSYAFSYKYTMEVTSKDAKTQQMQMDFWLEPNAKYMGIEMKQQGMEMFQILDAKQTMAYNFVNSGGNKMAMSMDYGQFDTETEEDYSDYTITPLPDKTILGYRCTGKKMENDEWEVTFYYTQEVDVSINSMFQSDQTDNVPEELKQQFSPDEEYLLLSMVMKDKKNQGTKEDRSGSMECVALEKDNFTFATTGYSSY